MTDSTHRQVFLRLRSRTDDSWIAPPELNERLVDDARGQGTSRTEIVTRILAKTYGLSYTANDRSPAGTRPSSDSRELNLRLPIVVYQQIAVAAIGSGRRTVQNEILAALCAHYGLRLPAKPRRARAPRRPAQAAA